MRGRVDYLGLCLALLGWLLLWFFFAHMTQGRGPRAIFEIVGEDSAWTKLLLAAVTSCWIAALCLAGTAFRTAPTAAALAIALVALPWIALCVIPAAPVDIDEQPLAAVVDQGEHGRADAIHDLCYRYIYGYNAEQDYAKATLWCKRGAELNIASSQTLLAEMYGNGEGMAANPQLARYWYTRAAALGHRHAALMLYYIFHEGRGIATDEALATSYLDQSADAGYEAAMRIRSQSCAIPGA